MDYDEQEALFLSSPRWRNQIMGYYILEDELINA